MTEKLFGNEYGKADILYNIEIASRQGILFDI